MCLIAMGPLPDEAILRAAASDNPHGIGAAWYTARGVTWRKGLTVDNLLALPAPVRKYLVVHFRLATAGGNTAALIHPFPVEKGVRLDKSGTADRVLFHNGHLLGWERKLPLARKLKGPVSDSRLLALLAWRYGPDVLSLLENQRTLVLSKKKISMQGTWIKEGERWFSNDSFRLRRGYGAYDRREWEQWDTWDAEGLGTLVPIDKSKTSLDRETVAELLADFRLKAEPGELEN